jgi:homoserine/homoserine lactone efflux protein
MAITMVMIDLIVMAAYTGLASKILRLLRSPKQQKYLNRSFAVMFSCAAALLSAIQQAS